MAKGDDAVRKKKNKKDRKKLNRDTSKVSTRVAAIIAAKKRRMSGKRRMCQGMCFSLPTLEDPFNDKNGKVESKREVKKKLVHSNADNRLSAKRNGVAPRAGATKNQELKMVNDLKNELIMSLTYIDNVEQKKPIKLQGHAFKNPGCPSKFLILCLNSIQDALRHDEAFSSEEDKPLFFNSWGVEFWKYYSTGKDILDTSGAYSTTEQVAWIASSAADTITRKEQEGVLFTSPFLLFLVPSQEKAAKVRSVCKPLKALGVHTVSLHPGSSLDHQIHGLKICEPEFLVSTPERLLELVSLKAVDISGVSLLVVDGLQTLLEDGYTDVIKSIRQSISGNPQTLVFNDCLSCASIPVVQNLMQGSICRLSLDDSIISQSAFIMQPVHVCVSEEKRLSKGIQILDELGSMHSKVLFIVGKNGNVHDLVTAIKSKGYSVSTRSTSSNSELENSKLAPAVFVFDIKHVSTANISEFEVIIIFNFVLSIDNYIKILSKMARFTVNGALHSFLTTQETLLAGPLIETLEKCGQTVPEAVRQLCDSSSSSLLEH